MMLFWPFVWLMVLALYVFAYHYERNGNPENWGDFVSRVIWAASFTAGYMALDIFHLRIVMIGYFMVASFVEILVPHAFAQNMGRWAHPWKYDQDGVTLMTRWKYWPGLWLPQYTQAEWDALAGWKKTALDFAGMFSTGFLRGAIVFGGPSAFGWLGHGGYVAWGLTALWQPFSYLAGRYTPWNAFGNSKGGADWGEFYVPIGWAIAILVALKCA